MKLLILLFSSFVLSTNSCKDQHVELNSNPELTKVDEPSEEIIKVDEYIKTNKLEKYARATFAGGCFWCTEAAFHRINGVVDVISGYSGGEKTYPNYYEVGSGKTKHAEAIEIFYDDSVIDFNTLLEVFFVAHDGTQLNRQGPDVGPQYRSAIFYKDENQKNLSEAYILKIEEAQDVDIVTQIAPYEEFWVAEKYHQDFYELNPNQSYVRSVSRPKVEKVKKKFPHLLKEKL